MLIFIIFLFISAILLEAFSLKIALKSVAYSCRPSCNVLEPNEEFEIITTLENRKLFPVSYLEIAQQLPAEIKLNAYLGRFRSEPQISYLYSSCYLMSRQKLTRKIKATLTLRGRYFIQGATMVGGDILGLSKTNKNVDFFHEIVVIPQRIDAPSIEDALGGFLGDVSVNRFILEDPVLTAGISEYTGREPMKAIDWKRSAALSRLMVKKFDYTVENSVTIILNVYSNSHLYNSETREKCFSLARMAVEELEKRAVKYCFMTNAMTAGAIGFWSEVAEGLGPAHCSSILEGLGRATSDFREDCDTIINRACAKNERGRAHVIITPFDEDLNGTSFSKLTSISDGRTFVITSQDADLQKEEN